MHRILVFIFSAILFFSGCTEQRKKPNIILINIDDLGWKDLGCQGSEFYSTPNIDALSKLGMVFNNGYASASNCAPSRASLMTGLWTPRHGIYTVNSSARGRSENRKLIPTENTTTIGTEHILLPELLKQNGYTTCHAGKWHLSDDPMKRGFDKNIGGGHNGHPKSYYPPYKNVNLIPGNGEYLTDFIMTKTIDFVKSTEQPFFLNYAPYAVHTPIHPVDALRYKYANKPASNGQDNIGYATMIENLDRNIGLLLIALRDLGVMENTFIVFTSDNGGLFGITSQTPLRAGKGSYYEGGIKVPFFFVWQGNIHSNSESDIPATNIDILPTVLEIAGIDETEFEFDGQSILPVLKGNKIADNRPLFWHFPIYLQAYLVENAQNRDTLFRTRPGSVIRYGDWKLHQYFEDGGLELYNLKEDIGETKNLAQKQPRKVEELLSLLNNWREKVNAPIPQLLNPDYKE
jgi:arylsulfatase A-like enzyme